MFRCLLVQLLKTKILMLRITVAKVTRTCRRQIFTRLFCNAVNSSTCLSPLPSIKFTRSQQKHALIQLRDGPAAPRCSLEEGPLGWPLVWPTPDQPRPRALHQAGGGASPTARNDRSGAERSRIRRIRGRRSRRRRPPPSRFFSLAL